MQKNYLDYSEQNNHPTFTNNICESGVIFVDNKNNFNNKQNNNQNKQNNQNKNKDNKQYNDKRNDNQ